MVHLNCKTQKISSPPEGRTSNLPSGNKAAIATSIKLQVPSPALPFRPSGELSPATESACVAYEQYLRLPELRRLWDSTTADFPGWEAEPILKPALQALEITFRFLSIVFSDPRPYSNRRQWTRRLESLASKQVEIIAQICGPDSAAAPVVDLTSSHGVLPRRDGSSAEVWHLSGVDNSSSSSTATFVSRASEASLLPRLAAWGKSEPVATKIQYSIECAMRNCPYTLGLGEPNLSRKPTLDYDAVCRPSELHALKKIPPSATAAASQENQTVYTVHQIIESWIQVSKKLLDQIENRIDGSEFDRASSDCWLLELVWNLLGEIEQLHLLMDPDDFLRLKAHLHIGIGGGSSGSASSDYSICFRSKALIELTKRSKDLKHKVPGILGVEVDPMGGPVIQEAAMSLYNDKRPGSFGKIHLLQGMQALEAAVKRFFYGYKQLLVVVMGSLEANGNRPPAATAESAAGDSLEQIYMEPAYYPSLDAAKTFLGGYWDRQEKISGAAAADRSIRCSTGR